MEEIATISVMCNDSAIDFNEFKNAFEKVGEATEAALIVLAEKINPYGVEKRGGRLETAKIVRKVRPVLFYFGGCRFPRKVAVAKFYFYSDFLRIKEEAKKKVFLSYLVN